MDYHNIIYVFKFSNRSVIICYNWSEALAFKRANKDYIFIESYHPSQLNWVLDEYKGRIIN